jgi:phosphonate transport system ATP-binding protein
MGGAPALEARDVWFSYVAGRPVLKGINLSVEANLITVVLGASGSGKTTLLKTVKGLLRPQQGSISVLDRPPPVGGARLDSRVAYIPQQLGLVRSLSALDNTLTGALGNVSSVASVMKLFPRECLQEAYQILAAVGIADKMDEKVYSLSGGERQRVAIARALMQRPRLVLADEFISQLDPINSVEIMEIMRGIVRRGVSVVMTTHELDIVARYADRVVVLRDGRKVLDCPAREALVEDLGAVIKT